MIPSTNAAARLPLEDTELDDAGADGGTEGAESGDGASTGTLSIDGGGFSTVNESITNFHGTNEGVSIFGDGGNETVNVFGEFSGTVEGNDGEDGFIAHAGSEVRDSEIRGGGGEDGFIQHEGATFVGTTLRGDDGADIFQLAGHSEGTLVDLGHNGEQLDRLRLMPTVTGDIRAVDPDHSEYHVKDEKLSDHDAVELVNGDGRTWVENEDGNYALRDDASGEIVSEFEAGGNRKSIENIASYDLESGETVEQFRDIDPELKYSSMWAKWAGDIFGVAGMFIPALLPVSAAFKTYHAADNGLLSWETGLDIGLGAIPAGTTLTYAKNGVKTVHAFAEGDIGAGLSGVASFVPGGDVRNLVYGAGQGWTAIDAIGDGDYALAARSFGNAGAVSGLDTGGHLENGFDTAAHLVGGYEAFVDGNYLGAGRKVYAAGETAGVDFSGEPSDGAFETTLPESYTSPARYTGDASSLELAGGDPDVEARSAEPEIQFVYGDRA